MQPQNGKPQPFLTRLNVGIQSTADQCQILHNGCDLNYDEIMAIAESGQVLIEQDIPDPNAEKPKKKPGISEDDELDEILKEIRHRHKVKKIKPFIEIQPIVKQNTKIVPGEITEIQLGELMSHPAPNPIKTAPSRYGSPNSVFNIKKKKTRPYRHPLNSESEEPKVKVKVKIFLTNFPCPFIIGPKMQIFKSFF